MIEGFVDADNITAWETLMDLIIVFLPYESLLRPENKTFTFSEDVKIE